MKRVIVDVDGVLADFVGGILDAVEASTGHRPLWRGESGCDVKDALDKRDAEFALEALFSPGFCSNLRPLSGALAGVRELAKAADVRIVTALPVSESWASERMEWLRHRGFSKDQIVFTGSKYLVEADAIVDDRRHVIEQWIAHRPKTLAFMWESLSLTAPAPAGSIRCSDWSAVRDLLS